jgi:hypothetical protein
MWFISVKRNIARLVPAMKNDCAAAREVRMPAVAAGGVPYTPDCVVRCRPVSRLTPRVSICS